jgi:hypothetical protein
MLFDLCTIWNLDYIFLYCVFVDEDNSPAQLSLEFRVFLVSAQTGKHTQESRTLQFWFASSTSDAENATVAQEFFRELVSPQDFPRGMWFDLFVIHRSFCVHVCACTRVCACVRMMHNPNSHIHCKLRRGGYWNVT